MSSLNTLMTDTRFFPSQPGFAQSLGFSDAKILRRPLDNNSAMIQLMAGGGVALIGTTLVPLLSGLFS